MRTVVEHASGLFVIGHGAPVDAFRTTRASILRSFAVPNSAGLLSPRLHKKNAAKQFFQLIGTKFAFPRRNKAIA